MKRCSTLLITREMQIKTTMRFHLTSVRVAIMKKSTNNKSCRTCGEKGTLLYYWWECKLVQPLWRFLETLKLELSYDPTIPQLGIYPKETIIERNASTPMFVAALFTMPWTWKQPRGPSTDKWIKKLWYIYTLEYYSAIKRTYLSQS